MMIISSSFSFSAILFRPWLLTIRTGKLEGRRIVEVRRHYIFIVGQPSAKTFREGKKSRRAISSAWTRCLCFLAYAFNGFWLGCRTKWNKMSSGCHLASKDPGLRTKDLGQELLQLWFSEKRMGGYWRA